LDNFDPRQTLFIEVLLPLNLSNTFTYRVPYELNEEVIEGKRVSVPFGKSKVMAGLIFSIQETPPKDYQARYIFDILDNETIVHPFQLELWAWMASYYMTSLGLVYNAAMPAGLKLEGESKLILNPDYDSTLELDPNEFILLETLKANKEISIAQASSLLKLKQIHKYIHSLYLKGCILLKEDINEVYKPKVVNYITISPNVQSDKQLNLLFDELEKRAKKQLQALMTFIAKYSITGEAEKTELAKHDLTNSAINALIDKGVFLQESRTKSRLNYSENRAAIETLETEQEEAYNQIQHAFLDQKPALLFGVTGSGKTHIYSKLIQENIDQGKQVLYLLPEIALTSQLIDRLQKYFGEHLIVSHSKFSNNERVEVYKSIHSGKPQLIVGTRSAIFQPFQNLGLIIVDEEHESSFKQNEPAPRFNARDTALYLAHKKGANILLGSATPAVESYYNATQGKYALVQLTKRYDGAIMPHIEIVDMQAQKKQKRIRGIFSDTLLDAIAEAKKNNKQVILFQNKKGYVPVLECNVCAWTPKCQNCDISLTFYKYQENLRCHYCGYTQEVVSQCGLCNNKGIELIGYGTERIEDELTLYMPELRVKRMDQNTTRLKNAHSNLIHEFAEGKIDVLIGTQMVAKGLDFENVTTVGILNADHLINFPDFRANERAFQLMTQVAGRAGRRKEQGKVYIQTSKPDHYVIQQIVDHDYVGMYNNDIAERKSFDYTPYYRLVKISLKHKDPLLLSRLGSVVKQQLIAYFGNSLLGPEKPYVSKIRNWYILNFVLKIENNGPIVREQKRILALAVDQLHKQKDFSQARIIVDVDPM
jgi:primosomal protein N' (replication factor Y) (superfamily II helicase)